MADDERDPRPSGEGDAPADETAPLDDTRAHPPLDATNAHPPVDETSAHPPVDETRAFSPLDETGERGLPGEAGTAVQPGAAPAGDATQPLPGSWTARAEVPPPRPAEPTAWQAPPEEDGGRWWMPIVIGLVALLLLGVLGYGLWLIAGSSDDETGDPATPAPTARVTTRPATTAPPTTDAPTAPATVEVPRLTGEPLDSATARLDELGLRYRVRYEITDAEEPGTVLRTEPRAGREVEQDSRVTLYVAAPPEPTEPPAPTGSAPPGDEDDGGQ